MLYSHQSISHFSHLALFPGNDSILTGNKSSCIYITQGNICVANLCHATLFLFEVVVHVTSDLLPDLCPNLGYVSPEVEALSFGIPNSPAGSTIIPSFLPSPFVPSPSFLSSFLSPSLGGCGGFQSF